MLYFFSAAGNTLWHGSSIETLNDLNISTLGAAESVFLESDRELALGVGVGTGVGFCWEDEPASSWSYGCRIEAAELLLSRTYERGPRVCGWVEYWPGDVGEGIPGDV